MVPGGLCATATDVQQEGLRLPPARLVCRGELIQDVGDVIMSNIRVPEERLGDMRKRSETLMRAHIEAIPDGTYSFSMDR